MPSGSNDALAQWEAISRRVQQTQRRLVEPIEAEGVASQWFAVLHLLLHAPERRMPMTRLAAELTMTSGGFTKLADRMATEGLIDRRNSTGDRRVVHAALTPEGLRLARRTEKLYRTAVQEHVLDVLTPATLTALADQSAPLDLIRPAPPDEEAITVPRDASLPDRRRSSRASGPRQRKQA